MNSPGVAARADHGDLVRLVRPWSWCPLWIEEAPPARLAVARGLVCLYATVWLIARTPAVWAPALDLSATRHWAPVGLLSVLPNAPPLLLVIGLHLLGIACGLLATTGRWIRTSLPLFAICFMLLATLRSSVGMLFHTENLTALHLLVLAAHAQRTVIGSCEDEASGPTARREATAVMTTLTLVTLSVYLVAGIAKIRGSGLAWADGVLLRDQVAWDNLRKLALGDVGSPLVGPLLRMDGLWPALAAVSLLVELGAPLAIVHPRVLRAWMLASWSFHVGIVALMAIVFPYPLLGIAYVSMLPCERLPWCAWTLGRSGHDP